VAEVRDWLQAVGGVHLYHRGLRVRPHGDPGHDWLDMNLLRTRNGSKVNDQTVADMIKKQKGELNANAR